MMDNASTNDTMLGAFPLHMKTPSIPFNVLHRRLQCTRYIINHLVESILFGNSTSAIQNAIYVAGTDDQLSLW